MDQSVAASSDDWGFQPAKGGMAIEAKLGMFIIMILLGAFGFLVYRKVDQRERELASAQQPAAAATADNNESTGGPDLDLGVSDRTDTARTGDFEAQLAHLDSASPDPALASFEDDSPQESVIAAATPELNQRDEQFGDDLWSDEQSSDPAGDVADDNDPFSPEAFTEPEVQVAESDVTIPAGINQQLDRETAASDTTERFQDDNASPTATAPDEAFLAFDEFSADDAPQADSDLSDDLIPQPAPAVAVQEDDGWSIADSTQDTPDVQQEQDPFASEESGDVVFNFDDDAQDDSLQFDPDPTTPGQTPEIQIADDDLAITREDLPGPLNVQDDEAVGYRNSAPLGDAFADEPVQEPEEFVFADAPEQDFNPDDDTPFGGDQEEPDLVLADPELPVQDATPDMQGLSLPQEEEIALQDVGSDVSAQLRPVLPVRNEEQPPPSLAQQDRAFSASDFAYENRVITASAQEESYDVVEVHPGDNYWKISRRAYGSSRYFSALALYNRHRVRDPKKLRPGMKILIPDAELLEQKYPQLFRDSAPRERRPTGYFVQPDGTAAYRIGERDTLSQIAQKHLGRSSRWIQIYRLNQHVLSNPNRLKPGTVIVLPDSATNVHMVP